MLLQTFWYQTLENLTKTELSRHYSLNYSCKCKPTFGPPCMYVLKKQPIPSYYTNNALDVLFMVYLCNSSL